jgi:cystathionine gamma-synthase
MQNELGTRSQRLPMSKQDHAPRQFNTTCVHAANVPDPATGAIAPPIHLATTFERDADGGYSRGYRYGREGTPNRAALEECVAALEGGVAALAFASGLAANLAIFEQLAAGARVVAARQCYYGTQKQLREIVTRRGIEVDFVDATDTAALARAVDPRTRLVWVETPANPLLSLTDLAAAAEIAHASGALLVCDSTFATPFCQRPFEWGADLVVHSGTKYLGGHSDVLSGLVVVHRDEALAARLREYQRLGGAVLAPFDCWLLRRSLSTLGLRMRQQCANAHTLANWLSDHPRVERVLYPGLAGHPGHALAQRQMSGGFGAMLSILVRGERERAMAVAARTHLFRRATSLGGVESLIEHRASIEGPGSIAPENLLRLSVGIEDPLDLIADLDAALA